MTWDYLIAGLWAGKELSINTLQYFGSFGYELTWVERNPNVKLYLKRRSNCFLGHPECINDIASIQYSPTLAPDPAPANPTSGIIRDEI